MYSYVTMRVGFCTFGQVKFQIHVTDDFTWRKVVGDGQSHFGRIGILLHVWYRISVTRLRTKTYQKTPKFDFGDDLVISFSRQNGWKSWNLTCLSFNYDLVFTWNQIVAILVSFGSKSLWLFWCSWYGIKHGVEFLYGQNECEFLKITWKKYLFLIFY